MGYESVFADELVPQKSHLLLRHDVDVSLKYAVEVAKIEKICDVKSTFFVQITSDFYNALSKNSFMLMKEILDDGHRIGIHVDIGDVERIDQIGPKVKAEAQILSNFLSVDVNTFSFHRPGALKKFKDYHQINLEGFINFYDRRLFKDIKYVSDSRGGWYYGHPLETEEAKQGKAMQLLTHPIWWGSMGRGCETAREVLHKHVEFRGEETLKLFGGEFRIF